MPKPRFTVVVPCYNEEGMIAQTIEGLRRHLGAAGPHEIVVVDDGSTDRTSAVLDEIGRRDAALRVVRHVRNQGYGAALKTGLRRAAGELIVITDADGTYPQDRIADLVTQCDSADMVVGARSSEDVTQPLPRRVAKGILKAYASWLVGQPIPDMNSGLRVFRKDIAERYLKILPDGFSFTTTITMAMMRHRYDVRFVPITCHPRVGTSKIRPVRDTLGFLQLIVRTGMYFAPLRVMGPVILALVLGSLASLAYDVFVLSNLTDKTVILLFSCMNVTLLALVADMLDRRSPG